MRVNYIIVLILSMVASANQFAIAQKRPNIICIISEGCSSFFMTKFNAPYGVSTPCINALGGSGIVFENAFSNTLTSDANQSAIFSGCWGSSLGSKSLPEYLHEAGYLTITNSKKGYSEKTPNIIWEEPSSDNLWGGLPPVQPFFYVHHLSDTNEEAMNKSSEYISEYIRDYTEVIPFVQPNMPNTELSRDNYTYYCMKVQEMDAKLGSLIARLNTYKLIDETIIFYFSDNGAAFWTNKCSLSDSGLSIPMIVRVPRKYKHLVSGATTWKDKRFVSLVDLAPTIMQFAGIEPPQNIDGKSFWAKGKERDKTAWAYTDRVGNNYDMVRSLRVGDLKYVRNFTPFNFNGMTNSSDFVTDTEKEWRGLFNEGKLKDSQAAFFKTKPVEALYDISIDPYELNNLADDPKYKTQLITMRSKMIKWQKTNLDLGFYPEFILAKSDSESFRDKNTKNIHRYIDLAALQLEDFKKAKGAVLKALKSDDMLQRYWGLIICSSFGEDAKELLPYIEKISTKDSSLINRVRAAEYMGLIGYREPQEVILSALYETKDPLEALLILNSITMLSQGSSNYIFDVDFSKVTR